MKPTKDVTDRSRKYYCKGEKFSRTAHIGYVGETKTLMEWMVELTRQTESYLSAYFDEELYTNKDVVEYIQENYGKRLIEEVENEV